MPKYELIYFDGRGRAELSRWIFAIAGQEYDDVRLTKEQWPEKKPDAPFGQLPMLIVDGNFKLGQSNAIARFLGKRFGLMGSHEFDEARINMVIDCVEDMVQGMMKMLYGEETAKVAAKEKWLAGESSVILAKFEKLLTDNKDPGGYFVGSAITVADLSFVVAASFVEMFGFKEWDKFPKVVAIKKLVTEDNAAVKNWIATRPVTQM